MSFAWIQLIVGALLLTIWIIAGSIDPNPKD